MWIVPLSAKTLKWASSAGGMPRASAPQRSLAVGLQGKGLEPSPGEGLEAQQPTWARRTQRFQQLRRGQVDAAGRLIAAGPPQRALREKDRRRRDGSQLGAQAHGRAGRGRRLFTIGGYREGQGKPPHGFGGR